MATDRAAQHSVERTVSLMVAPPHTASCASLNTKLTLSPEPGGRSVLGFLSQTLSTSLPPAHPCSHTGGPAPHGLSWGDPAVMSHLALGFPAWNICLSLLGPTPKNQESPATASFQICGPSLAMKVMIFLRFYPPKAK